MVATTRSMARSKICSKNRFFDMFNIPREGILYTGESDFDFDQYVEDYNNIHAQPDPKNEFCKVVMRLVDLQCDVNTDDESYITYDLLLLLGMFLLINSYVGRNIRSRYPRYWVVAERKFNEMLSSPFQRYSYIIPYLPPMKDDYYEYVGHCWDKVSKGDGDGVFLEFDEYVVDPSNMMSEVLRFV